jgi:hypothetical protein
MIEALIQGLIVVALAFPVAAAAAWNPSSRARGFLAVYFDPWIRSGVAPPMRSNDLPEDAADRHNLNRKE